MYEAYCFCKDKIHLYTYAHLLISLPYLISSMYGHRLLKQISLIFVFKRGGPGSIQNQNMRDSWWTKWHCDRFSLEYFSSTLSVSFPQNSIVNFIYVLLLPEEQTGEAWKPSKKLSFFFENGGAWDIKWTYFHFFRP